MTPTYSLKKIIGYLLSLIVLKTYAQLDSVPPLSFSGFTDVYYSFNTSGKQIKEIPYAYNHSRNQDIQVNLALLQAKLSTSDFRANLGLQTGTYSQYNYSSEPSLFQHLYDANAGFRIYKNFWLDAGIFGSSHIGFESAISKDNWTLTRSLCAENTPYYEAGAKIHYEPEDGKLFVSFIISNGWQVIQDNNTNKALGYQITYQPNEMWRINASSFIGEGYNLKNSKSLRYFHHLYVLRKLPFNFETVAIFDAGIQEELNNRTYRNAWYNPTFMLRKIFSERWASCIRGEYYNDPNNIIITTLNNKGFKTFGYSFNLDFRPYSNVLLRIEGRRWQSKNDVFLKNNQPAKVVSQITGSIAVSF